MGEHPTVALHWFRLYLGERTFAALEARAYGRTE